MLHCFSRSYNLGCQLRSVGRVITPLHKFNHVQSCTDCQSWENHERWKMTNSRKNWLLVYILNNFQWNWLFKPDLTCFFIIIACSCSRIGIFFLENLFGFWIMSHFSPRKMSAHQGENSVAEREILTAANCHIVFDW